MIRWGVLAVILVGMTSITTAHQYMNVNKPPGVDALCPFGGLETLFTFISGGTFIHRTAASALILFVMTLFMTLIWRRSFCGQLCPLGTLQELFGTLGRRISKTRREVPRFLDGPARLLKYAVLLVFAVWTWRTASLVIRPFDPWAAYAHLTSDELLTEFGVGVAVLGVSLAGSFVYERFFCKYLCPTGALLGLFSKFSAFGIRRDPKACVDCGACDEVCPMNIEVATADLVASSECISCSECVNACPAAGALEVKSPNGGAVTPFAMTALVAGILVAAVVGGTAAGGFSWRMPTLLEAVEQSGGTAGGAGFDTGLIRGYMSLSEIAEATGIPAREFSETFGVPESALGQPMKEIKDTYGFSPEEVRAWVAQRTAGP